MGLPHPDKPPIILPIHILPSATEIYFHDSSFFTRHGDAQKLPSPAQVRARSNNNASSCSGTPPPVRFPAPLNLLVKYGREITIAEGQCLWAIRKFLGGRSPRPRSLRVVSRRGRDFYLHGAGGWAYEGAMGALSREDQFVLCEQLRGIVAALRRLEQDPEERFVGR